jgi:hypothetical protein
MRSSSLSLAAVLTGRALLLVLAAAAALAGFLAVRSPAPPVSAVGQAPAAYVCPMHPDVVATVPGDCPICGMALAPAQRGDAHAHDPASAPESVVLPAPAAIASFDELGFGKRYEMARELRAPAWAEADGIVRAVFYRDEVALLGANETAIFFPSTGVEQHGSPGLTARRIDEPPTDWDDATVLIRLRLGANTGVPAGRTGWIKFPTRVRDLLAVRASAVLPSPEGPYVLLVADDKRTLTKRPIRIGSVLYEHAAVLSGLEVGERVAVQNTFLLDAERRMAGRGAP